MSSPVWPMYTWQSFFFLALSVISANSNCCSRFTSHSEIGICSQSKRGRVLKKEFHCNVCKGINPVLALNLTACHQYVAPLTCLFYEGGYYIYIYWVFKKSLCTFLIAFFLFQILIPTWFSQLKNVYFSSHTYCKKVINTQWCCNNTFTEKFTETYSTSQCSLNAC